MTWSPEGRRRRGRPEMKWEREVERVMKQKNVTPEDALNRQLWLSKIQMEFVCHLLETTENTAAACICK
jgi:hypothetical protein